MPYVSKAQQGFFHWKAKHSKKWKKMAAKWDKHSKGNKNLPEHKK